MGNKDLRHTPTGDIDYHFSKKKLAMVKTDPPPDKVKPVPTVVIHRIAIITFSSTDAIQQ